MNIHKVVKSQYEMGIQLDVARLLVDAGVFPLLIAAPVPRFLISHTYLAFSVTAACLLRLSPSPLFSSVLRS